MGRERTDTERLDWLERKGAWVMGGSKESDGELEISFHVSWLEMQDGESVWTAVESGLHATQREAIDAAMDAAMDAEDSA